MEIALLGHMGRDEAAADRLQEHTLHILGQWENPGLVDKAEASGGSFQVVDSIANVGLIADKVQAIEPDMFFTNFDDALAAGVVDTIRQRVADRRMPDLLIPCPDKETAKIEWDKFYLRDIIDEIDPKYNPLNFMAETTEQVHEAEEYFEAQGIEIAVKPRNLTGGKGVKVMGKHFATFAEGKNYALQVLESDDQDGVEVQEKLEGHEFTLQLFTDGTTMIKPPATYDYPYREDGNTGPGTGGMGDFSMQDGLMPFLTEADYKEAFGLMEQVLFKLKERDHDYKGVLYPTFFKTPEGLKIVEINARGGDPELINVIDLIDDNIDFGEVLKLIALGELADDSVRYKKLASAMVYLVSPDYSYREGRSYEFGINPEVVAANNCRIRFAAAERTAPNKYRTVGSSRTVGVFSDGATPWEARHNIHETIREGFEQPLTLDYRREVAEEAYIRGLVI
jgi:phosphoribosylamine--glycine ligase